MKALRIKEYGNPLVKEKISKLSPGYVQVSVKLNVTGIYHTGLN